MRVLKEHTSKCGCLHIGLILWNWGTILVIMVTTLKISCLLTMRFTRMDHLTSNVLFGWLLTSRLWQNLNTLLNGIAYAIKTEVFLEIQPVSITMACDSALESPREIIYRSYLCPHPKYKFDIDQSKKAGHTGVFLHQILGWEAGVWINDEARHRVISWVRDY